MVTSSKQSIALFDFSLLAPPTQDQVPYVSMDIIPSCLVNPIAWDPTTTELWVCEDFVWRSEISGIENLSKHIRCELETAMASGLLYYTIVDDKGAVVPRDFSAKKKSLAESILDRIVTTLSRDMRVLISESPWSAWENVAIRWDVQAGTLIAEPLSPDQWCTHKQNQVFPVGNVTLLDTPDTSSAWKKMLGPDAASNGVEILETYVGAALLKANPNKALYLRGEPGIGKSTYTNIFSSMLPSNAVCTLDIRHDNNFLFSKLPGKSAVVQHEMKQGALPCQDQLRSAICGETVPVNEKNKPEVDICPRAVWVMASNFDLEIGIKGARSTMDRFHVLVANGPKVRDTISDVQDYWKELLKNEGNALRIRCIARFVQMMENNRKLWKEAQKESMNEIVDLLSENDPQRKFFSENVEITNNPEDRIFMVDYAEKYLVWLRTYGGDVRAAFTDASARKFFREQIGMTIPKTNRTRHQGKPNQWYASGVKWNMKDCFDIELKDAIASL